LGYLQERVQCGNAGRWYGGWLGIQNFEPLPIFITIATSKFLLQSIFIALLLQKLKAKYLLKYLLIYEVYSSILSLTLIIFYFLPVKVRWKGRVY